MNAAVELDATSAASYRLNHPEVRVQVADIRSVTGPQLLRWSRVERGALTLLTACPPCQGFSALQTRRKSSPAADKRNDLIFDVLRLVRSVRPRVVLIENVPGLAKDDRFGRFREGLRRSGYQSDYRVLNACNFGVPQRRKRLVMVACRNRTVPCSWWEHSSTRVTVRSAISGLPPAGSSGDALHDLRARRSPDVLARIRDTPRDGGSRTDRAQQLPCHSRGAGYSDVYGRMAWDREAPTITSGCHNPSRGRFLHPEEDRAITLREAALLQSFPAEYAFDLTRGKEHVARQIGNAFPPPLIVPIASAISRSLER